MRTYFYKHTIVVVFAVIIALVMSVITTMAQSSSQEPIKLKVMLMPYLSFAALFIAEEEGFFLEQGLEIEFVQLGDEASKAIPALIQGDLDVGVSQVETGVLNAMARGGDLKIVADKGYFANAGCPAHSLMARRTLAETDALTDLRGKRFAVEKLTSEGYYVEKLLHEAGLTFDDIQFKNVPLPALSEAMATGAIDIAYVAEPWISRILATGHAVVWKNVEEGLPEFQGAVILYGPNLLHKNPDAGRKFMVAYLKAVRQYNQGKTDRNVEILAKYTKLTPELLQKACWPALKEDGTINMNSVVDFQVWSQEKGTLDKKLTEEQFWDNSFINYANQVLGPSSR